MRRGVEGRKVECVCVRVRVCVCVCARFVNRERVFQKTGGGLGPGLFISGVKSG